MKTKTTKFGLALGLAALVTAPALAQTVTPRIVFSQTNHLQATVEDIDHAKREVTLKGPDGNAVKVTVSDDVKNFPQIKKGDEVNVGYYESVALALHKPGEALAPTGVSEVLVRREPGEKPGGAAVSVSDITATVEDVDRENREVTLKGPDGNIVKVHVDPSVGNLERIKKGDQITASRTEALAVSVEAPEQKP
jgi:hypothetical protein